MGSHCHPLVWGWSYAEKFRREQSVRFQGWQSWGDRWQRENVTFKHEITGKRTKFRFMFCFMPFGCILIKLTIPGQPVGCSLCQRPTPLPGRSARKHRCSPRAAVGMLQLKRMLDEWLVWSGLVRETCEEAENRSVLCCARYGYVVRCSGMTGGWCHRETGRWLVWGVVNAPEETGWIYESGD